MPSLRQTRSQSPELVSKTSNQRIDSFKSNTSTATARSGKDDDAMAPPKGQHSATATASTKRHSTGTFSECGRHSNQWLFHGFSVTGTFHGVRVRSHAKELIEARVQRQGGGDGKRPNYRGAVIGYSDKKRADGRRTCSSMENPTNRVGNSRQRHRKREEQRRISGLFQGKNLIWEAFTHFGTMSPTAERKVLLVLAGGTICMQSSPDGYIPTKGLLGKCLAGHGAFDDGSHPQAAKIIDENGRTRHGDASFLLPNLTSSASSSEQSAAPPRIHYTAFEFTTLIDSSSADAKYWNTIARCIAANYAAFDGFVVLHGTDTLAFAASALSFALHPVRKPVVLTGSQVSIFDEPSDAWDNILGSLRFAGQGNTAEVCVFFHDALFRGNRAVKIHASEYAAFATPNMDPLATIDGTSKKIIDGGMGMRASPGDDVMLNPIVEMDSEHVIVLHVYPGLQLQTLQALLSLPGLRGVILETFGAGNMPGGVDGKLLTVLANAVERGMIIVNVSQCLNGTVSPIYAPARAMERLGVVYGHDMTTEAAYTKLLYLLASPGLTSEDIRRLMSQNIRGELTEREAGIDRSSEPTGELSERRNSLVVTSLQWRAYKPQVVGRSASVESLK
nr:60 kda lysophospholipase [Quercus suber]